MSTPHPGPDQPSPHGSSPPRHPDPITDPGRSQPFESLYRRQLPDGPATAHRVTARHYETSLTPPDEADPGDQFHWLYRREPADPAAEAPSEPVTAARPPAPVEPAAPPAAAVPPTVRPDWQDDPAEPDEPRTRSRSRAGWVILLVLLLVASAGAAVVLLQQRTDSSSARLPRAINASSVPSTSGRASATPVPPSVAPSSAAPSSSTASSTAPSTVPYVGTVVSANVAQVKADCQAAASTDGAGRRVSYEPAQLSDGDLSTAWRCEGAGRGRSLTFSLSAPTPVAELGLVNGYAKIDPKNRAHRYGEYRRVKQVRWTFPSGASFTQDLTDRTETMQTMRIPPQTAAEVELTILDATAPGESAKTRDAVLISEVNIATPKT